MTYAINLSVDLEQTIERGITNKREVLTQRIELGKVGIFLCVPLQTRSTKRYADLSWIVPLVVLRADSFDGPFKSLCSS